MASQMLPTPFKFSKSLNLMQVAIERSAGLSIFDLSQLITEMVPHHLISESLLNQSFILPIYHSHHQLIVAISDPTQWDTVLDLQFHTGLNIQAVIVEPDKLYLLRKSILNIKENNTLLNYPPVTAEQQVEIKDLADDSPVVKFINHIINDAITQRASDIHFEPSVHDYRIRFRIDGLLYIHATPPLALANYFSARIKVMSQLDIAEQRLPQDGHLTYFSPQKIKVDLRISICPTLHGEKIVMRILNPNNLNLEINELGFEATQLQTLLKIIKQPQGMILVTGPTGSGKSITLYSILRLLNQEAKNICAVEDPVEIILAGITQLNINLKTGLNFSTALKTFLRQDPDIIMIGEMRDSETAEIALKAAQTGHLVLSTLHTNSAATAISRLIHLGISPYQIANSLTLIIAQRLVRKLCMHCRDTELSCAYCHGGYKGRTGIFEVMSISTTISELIAQQSLPKELEKMALEQGMINLAQAAQLKIDRNETSQTEVNRVLRVNDL